MQTFLNTDFNNEAVFIFYTTKNDFHARITKLNILSKKQTDIYKNVMVFIFIV